LSRRVADVVAVTALAAIVIAIVAWPVLRAPSWRVFGMPIVGRYADPFTEMEQFGSPLSAGVYSQPVTDMSGALLARITGAVAAYNWLVLLSFPLSAAAAYLLARHLTLSRAAATVVAMAYAFSPFHLAQAAYHPHIAQTQWMPLYFLALWRCLDDASPVAVGFLAAATACVTLSNFYGGLIAAVITPVAVATYWLAMCRSAPRSMRRLGITVGTLVLIAVSGIVYVWFAARGVVLNRAAFAFPRADLFLYSAKWWSYLVPPVEHPLFAAMARRIWNAAGVRHGLLEQQVYLGWSLIALGLIAVCFWVIRQRQPASLARVPILVIVAVAALVCSLSPERTIGAFSFVRPSALLYSVVPMFRSYARFGVVVQLMAALLAGIGVDRLRAGATSGRIACAVLVAVVAFEYAVSPSAMSRDVLPTNAHRWVMQQADPLRVLDCTPLDQPSGSIEWLTGRRVVPLGGEIDDCSEANVSGKLAAMGYTHLLVPRETDDGQWFATHPVPDGLRLAARFDDAQVFAVTAHTPAMYTAAMTGFSPREYDSSRSWRWMEAEAAWTVVNTSAQPIIATLSLDLSAFSRARSMVVRLDGREVQTLVVEPSRRAYRIGPFVMPSGQHEMLFHPADAPTMASGEVDGDRRRLSFAIGSWSWLVGSGQR
jgi:hypothetical protein